MRTVKLSWSIIHAWETGNWEQSVGYYLGQPFPATPAMELGKLKHELWAEYTLKTGRLHDDLGGGPLVNPIVEQKYQKIIPLGDEYQILLRGVIDLEHGDIVEDYKCGQSQASSYVDSHQLGYYKLLRPNTKVGIYRCYNPYTKERTLGIKYLTDKVAEDALEHIITFGSEVLEYLQAEKLFKDWREE